MVKAHFAIKRAELAGKWVNHQFLRVRLVHDLVAVVLRKQAGKAGYPGTGVNDGEFARYAPGFEPPADQHGALIGCGGAAVGRWRDRHHQIAAAKFFQFALERIELASHKTGWKLCTCLCAGACIVTKPGGVIVVNASGQHQPVVAKSPLCGVHLSHCAVNRLHLRGDEAVTQLPGESGQVDTRQTLRRAVYQPGAAQGQGAELGITVDQDDVQLGRTLAQGTCSAQPPPAAANDDDPLTRGRARGRRAAGRPCLALPVEPGAAYCPQQQSAFHFLGSFSFTSSQLLIVATMSLTGVAYMNLVMRWPSGPSRNMPAVWSMV